MPPSQIPVSGGRGALPRGSGGGVKDRVATIAQRNAPAEGPPSSMSRVPIALRSVSAPQNRFQPPTQVIVPNLKSSPTTSLPLLVGSNSLSSRFQTPPQTLDKAAWDGVITDLKSTPQFISRSSKLSSLAREFGLQSPTLNKGKEVEDNIADLQPTSRLDAPPEVKSISNKQLGAVNSQVVGRPLKLPGSKSRTSDLADRKKRLFTPLSKTPPATNEPLDFEGNPINRTFVVAKSPPRNKGRKEELGKIDPATPSTFSSPLRLASPANSRSSSPDTTSEEFDQEDRQSLSFSPPQPTPPLRIVKRVPAVITSSVNKPSLIAIQMGFNQRTPDKGYARYLNPEQLSAPVSFPSVPATLPSAPATLPSTPVIFRPSSPNTDSTLSEDNASSVEDATIPQVEINPPTPQRARALGEPDLANCTVWSSTSRLPFVPRPTGPGSLCSTSCEFNDRNQCYEHHVTYFVQELPRLHKVRLARSNPDLQPRTPSFNINPQFNSSVGFDSEAVPALSQDLFGLDLEDQDSTPVGMELKGVRLNPNSEQPSSYMDRSVDGPRTQGSSNFSDLRASSQSSSHNGDDTAPASSSLTVNTNAPLNVGIEPASSAFVRDSAQDSYAGSMQERGPSRISNTSLGSGAPLHPYHPTGRSSKLSEPALISNGRGDRAVVRQEVHMSGANGSGFSSRADLNAAFVPGFGMQPEHRATASHVYSASIYSQSPDDSGQYNALHSRVHTPQHFYGDVGPAEQLDRQSSGYVRADPVTNPHYFRHRHPGSSNASYGSQAPQRLYGNVNQSNDYVKHLVPQTFRNDAVNFATNRDHYQSLDAGKYMAPTPYSRGHVSAHLERLPAIYTEIQDFGDDARYSAVNLNSFKSSDSGRYRAEHFRGQALYGQTPDKFRSAEAHALAPAEPMPSRSFRNGGIHPDFQPLSHEQHSAPKSRDYTPQGSYRSEFHGPQLGNYRFPVPLDGSPVQKTTNRGGAHDDEFRGYMVSPEPYPSLQQGSFNYNSIFVPPGSGHRVRSQEHRVMLRDVQEADIGLAAPQAETEQVLQPLRLIPSYEPFHGQSRISPPANFNASTTSVNKAVRFNADGPDMYSAVEGDDSFGDIGVRSTNRANDGVYPRGQGPASVNDSNVSVAQPLSRPLRSTKSMASLKPSGLRSMLSSLNIFNIFRSSNDETRAEAAAMKPSKNLSHFVLTPLSALLVQSKQDLAQVRAARRLEAQGRLPKGVGPGNALLSRNGMQVDLEKSEAALETFAIIYEHFLNTIDEATGMLHEEVHLVAAKITRSEMVQGSLTAGESVPHHRIPDCGM